MVYFFASYFFFLLHLCRHNRTPYILVPEIILSNEFIQRVNATRRLGNCNRAPPDEETGRVLGLKVGLLYGFQIMIRECVAGSTEMAGSTWCTLIAQRTTVVQPHPDPESNQSDSGPGEAA